MQEQAAYKKLENFKKSHEQRLNALQEKQMSDVERAQLIELNLDLVCSPGRWCTSAVAFMPDDFALAITLHA